MNLSDLAQLSGSSRFALAADLACLVGVLAALVSGLAHVRMQREAREPRGFEGLAVRLPLWCLFAALLCMGGHVWARSIEVNHFPSQTMTEVLNMFCTALVVSMSVLHFALGLTRRGAGWAILDDFLIALVLVGVFWTHRYIETLSTAQRDLPPALQSYWFPPHLSSLIFSYATMSIAALIGLSYFVTRFWNGVMQGGVSKRSQWLIFAGLALVPFVHIVTLPILAIGGIVFWILKKKQRLPTSATMARLEKDLDEMSFRAFAVGIPFLTAGLWMGAFWAQEAWANYWGWDSKENSALITWLVYIVYIHLRLLGGFRGAKAMSVLVGGALSVFLTFQVFGYLPDSQKSLHRYTDDNVKPMEGQQGGGASNEEARANMPATEAGGGERR